MRNDDTQQFFLTTAKITTPKHMECWLNSLKTHHFLPNIMYQLLNQNAFLTRQNQNSENLKWTSGYLLHHQSHFLSNKSWLEGWIIMNTWYRLSSLAVFSIIITFSLDNIVYLVPFLSYSFLFCQVVPKVQSLMSVCLPFWGIT